MTTKTLFFVFLSKSWTFKSAHTLIFQQYHLQMFEDLNFVGQVPQNDVRQGFELPSLLALRILRLFLDTYLKHWEDKPLFFLVG